MNDVGDVVVDTMRLISRGPARDVELRELGNCSIPEA